MRSLLLLYSLLVSFLLIGLGVSENSIQALYLLGGVPMSLYFSFQILKYMALKSRAKSELVVQKIDEAPVNLNQHVHYHYHEAPTEPPLPPPPLPEPQIALATKGVRDLDRRQFLKLIGSAGMAVFFLQLFSGKANAAFFGSVPGPGTVALKDSSGNLIDPAEKYPTDGYGITQVDDSGSTNYYGFVNKAGAWYIQKEDNSGNYRYIKGSSSFTTNWTNRASLTYDYFDNVF